MSVTRQGRAVVDAGLKAHSVDSGMPLVIGLPKAEYVNASDEHGVLRIAPGTGRRGSARSYGSCRVTAIRR